MSFLDRFRKPRVRSENPEVRRRAYETLQWAPSGENETFVRILLQERDPQLRAALAARIPAQADAWMSLLTSAYPDIVPVLAELAPNETGQQVLASLGDEPDPGMLQRLIEVFQRGGCRDTLLATLVQRHPAWIPDLIMHLPRGSERLHWAGQISEPASLETLAKLAKSADKRLYQWCRQQLRSIREQTEALEQARSVWGRHHDALEKLLAQSEAPLFREQFALLEHRFSELPPVPDSGLGEAVDRLRTQLRERVDAIIAAQRQRAEQQAACSVELAQALAQLQDTLALFEERETPLEPPEVAALDGLIKSQQYRWEAAAEQLEPDQQSRRQFEHLVKTLRQLPQQLQERATPSPAPAAGNLPQVQAERSRIEEMRAKLAPLFAQIQEQLQTGRSQAAVQGLQKVQQLLEACPTGELRDLRKRQRDMQRELSDLRDWARYAATPKYQSLIERMRSLTETVSEPRVRLSAIRALQTEWRDIGGQAPRELWEQFRTLSDAAYQTCEAWLQEEKALKALHLQARQTLLEDLEQFAASQDWDAADWKQVARLNREVRREWSRHTPVDRKEGAPLQKRFNAVLRVLEEQLAQAHERHESRYLSLIEQARALVDQEDLKAATDAARALQQEWKRTGPVSPRKNQALWSDFRSACDAIFARIEAQKVAEQASREEARTRKMEVDQTLRQELLQAAQWLLESAPGVDPATAPRFDAETPAGRLLACTCPERGAGTSMTELEILLDLPSPEHLTQERMALQMNRLSREGMQGRRRAVQEDLLTDLHGLLAHWSEPEQAEESEADRQRLMRIIESAADRLTGTSP